MAYGQQPDEYWLLQLLFGLWRKLRGQQDPEPEIEDDHDPEVDELAAEGDCEGLFQIMQQEDQFTPGLDAAAELVRLGDSRGRDHLIKVLEGPSAYLSEYARDLLKQLNDPRGNTGPGDDQPRTVAATPPAPSPYSDATRQQIFNQLSLRETDELEDIWQAHDTTQWRESAFEVIADILRQRLGQLPPRMAPAAPAPPLSAAPADDEMDPTIRELWMSGDFDRLARIMEYDNDWMLRLDSAEALARSGHDGGLHYLIHALASSRKDEREVAAEILDGLDDPQGNQALRAHRFPSAPASTSAAAYEEVVDDESPPEHLSPSDVWAEYRRKQQALEDDMARKAPRTDDGSPS